MGFPGTWMTESESMVYRVVPKCACSSIGQIMFYSDNGEYFDGDIHDGRDLPLILAGRGGGKLKSSLNLDYSNRPEPEQRLCNLHLSLANQMGVPMDRFGDSTGELHYLNRV